MKTNETTDFVLPCEDLDRWILEYGEENLRVGPVVIDMDRCCYARPIMVQGDVLRKIGTVSINQKY
jgi:hypothetical protein